MGSILEGWEFFIGPGSCLCLTHALLREHRGEATRILCAGNGISVGPYALARLGFDVTPIALGTTAGDPGEEEASPAREAELPRCRDAGRVRPCSTSASGVDNHKAAVRWSFRG